MNMRAYLSSFLHSYCCTKNLQEFDSCGNNYCCDLQLRVDGVFAHGTSNRYTNAMDVPLSFASSPTFSLPFSWLSFIISLVCSSTFITIYILLLALNPEIRRINMLFITWNLWLIGGTILFVMRIFIGIYHSLRITVNLWLFVLTNLVGRFLAGCTCVYTSSIYRNYCRYFLNSNHNNTSKFNNYSRESSRELLLTELDEVTSYDEWVNISKKLDVLEEKHLWKIEITSDLYDYQALMSHIDKLQSAVSTKDHRLIEFLLRSSCNRNFCNISNPELFEHCRVGTKKLLEDFEDLVCDALDLLCKHVEDSVSAVIGPESVDSKLHYSNSYHDTYMYTSKGRDDNVKEAANSFIKGFHFKNFLNKYGRISRSRNNRGTKRSRTFPACDRTVDPNTNELLRSASAVSGGSNCETCETICYCSGCFSRFPPRDSSNSFTPYLVQTESCGNSQCSELSDLSLQYALASDKINGFRCPIGSSPVFSFEESSSDWFELEDAEEKKQSQLFNSSKSVGGNCDTNRTHISRFEYNGIEPKDINGNELIDIDSSNYEASKRTSFIKAVSFDDRNTTDTNKHYYGSFSNLSSKHYDGINVEDTGMLSDNKYVSHICNSDNPSDSMRTESHFGTSNNRSTDTYHKPCPVLKPAVVSATNAKSSLPSYLPSSAPLVYPLASSSSSALSLASSTSPSSSAQWSSFYRGRRTVTKLLQHHRQFLASLRLSMGRTALCLSGGGALAMYHMGVVRLLVSQSLLPRVISGTSGGSVVAGIIAISTDEDLLKSITLPDISERYGKRWFPPVMQQIKRFILHGQMMDPEEFQSTCKAYYGNWTFAEAFAKTGRLVSVVVTPAGRTRGGGSGEPLVLNCVTTPDVLLWSAVAASCALPGLMPPSEIFAKDNNGDPVAYYPDGLKWIDGSIKQDIPHKELSSLFNVKQFIVSQVNPHAAPFVKPCGSSKQLSRSIENWLTLDIKNRYTVLAQFNMVPKIFGENISTFWMIQDHEGNITITPRASLFDWYRLINHPSEEDMRYYIKTGQTRAAPHISRIKHTLRIEQALRSCWARMERAHYRLKNKLYKNTRKFKTSR